MVVGKAWHLQMFHVALVESAWESRRSWEICVSGAAQGGWCCLCGSGAGGSPVFPLACLVVVAPLLFGGLPASTIVAGAGCCSPAGRARTGASQPGLGQCGRKVVVVSGLCGAGGSRVVRCSCDHSADWIRRIVARSGVVSFDVVVFFSSSKARSATALVRRVYVW